MNIKKILLKIIVVLVLLLPTLLFLNEMFRKQFDTGEQLNQRRDSYYSFDEGIVDVLFLGSSGLYAGAQPPVLWETGNISSYNLSTSDDNLFVRYHKLKEVLDNKPKVVLLDLTVLNSKSIDATGERLSSVYKKNYNFLNSMEHKRAFLSEIKALFPDVKPIEYLFPIIKHHTNWHEVTAYKQERRPIDHLLGALHNTRKTPVERRVTSEFNPLKTQVEYLEKIIQLACEKDVELVFAVMPRAVYNSKLSSYIEELSIKQDIPFFDYTSDEAFLELNLDIQEDFYDEGHLNIYGAEKLSGKLAEDLLREFPELNRENEAFSLSFDIWQDAVEKFQDRKKE